MNKESGYFMGPVVDISDVREPLIEPNWLTEFAERREKLPDRIFITGTPTESHSPFFRGGEQGVAGKDVTRQVF